MNKILHCLHDPLCGWCYGAGPALNALAEVPALELRLLPSGLFSGAGARPMDDAFAAYAWSNDQRIERMTGQRFTERYRHEVLADHRQMFDSGPASVALTAVALTTPQREHAALEALQQARYVDGRDITQVDTLTAVLEGLGLSAAAERLARSEAELLTAHQARVADAQALLAGFGARGVPTFILEVHGQRRLLETSAAFSNPHRFAEQIAAA